MENSSQFKYPGSPEAMDGNTAAIMCERESSDAAGAYPITPSTQMGEYWAYEAANGHLNTSGKPLIFVEPEGEHAAAAVTAGLSMTGLRATNFSSGQGIVYMHESLYPAVGKRLTYVLNMGCRAITKATLNVHAGHDDYHAIDDTGFFQVFAKNVQQVADLNIISHKIAELSLNPGIVGQDGFLTTHLIESIFLPERELIAHFLGKPSDIIETPTPGQELIFGKKRRRIPELWDMDNPVMAGVVQNQDSYMQSVASQRPFFFDHIEEIAIGVMQEYYSLTGRKYGLIETYNLEDAEIVFFGQGSVIPNAEVVSDYLRKNRGIKVGVVNLTMFRPFPGHKISHALKGKKAVIVLERLDQPLAEDLPLMKEIRSALGKSIENGKSEGKIPFPKYATYNQFSDFPELYSASFGMGSRDLQPEALIGAVENVLPGGKNKKMFYLSIDFIREKSYTKKQEEYQKALLEKYPNIKDLAVHGSENPNLMPEGAITVRIHSIGGWGAMATGKSLTITLSDILGYFIKSNPKYGSEKKGQPTTYYLAVAPEPIKINAEFSYVDAVLSPDPNVFKHSNPLAGLRKGGVFIIQSEQRDPDRVWRNIPKLYRDTIQKNKIKVFFLDAFKIAREEATDSDLQHRMQGMAFQGSFFAVSEQMRGKLTEEELFAKIKEDLEHKFKSKGKRVIEDNLRVVMRGYLETKEILEFIELDPIDDALQNEIPASLKLIPSNANSAHDIHRFWEETAYFYKTGKGNDVIADPFIGISLIPAATGVFKDMTNIRFEHPQWVPENCTGCGSCWTVCPDSAIPGLVNSISEIFQTALKNLKSYSRPIEYIEGVLLDLEERIREKIETKEKMDSFQDLLVISMKELLKDSDLNSTEKQKLERELKDFHAEFKDFQFSITAPYYSRNEKKKKGSGGLLSITLNPSACKGCVECITVCNDHALLHRKQTPESVDTLHKNWKFWNSLPNTKSDYIRIDNLDEGIGALETLLLDKNHYQSMVGGDGACMGCAEKTVLHLFTAVVTALVVSKVRIFLEKIERLIQSLEGDTGESTRNQSIRQELKEIQWRYMEGETGKGRSSMGIINSTGCSSVWASTYPTNPYPFPWASHLFQDSPSMAMGIFEGNMRKMADQFRVVREAEEILGIRNKEDLTYFNWKKFTDEELALCPPIVAVGGDGAMYDIGFQNLSRLMMSGKPIKVLILDTQVYSNTGGQACTSGFTGQVSDMAAYAKIDKGKEEIRKEICLVGIAHRTSYILQSSMATPSHLIEGFIEGVRSNRPAVFNIFCSCPVEHGVADDLTYLQSKLALESRAYPILKFNPDKGNSWKDCLDLDGNPEIQSTWPEYRLKYLDERGVEKYMKISMTFADYAATEGRFRNHFKKVSNVSQEDEKMVAFSDYLDLSEQDAMDKFPFIWAVDSQKHLVRLIPSEGIVEAARDRIQFWNILRDIAGLRGHSESEEDLHSRIREEMLGKFTETLMTLGKVEL